MCVRRTAELQTKRIRNTCDGIAALLKTNTRIPDDDIRLTDAFLAPGYGWINEATAEAIRLGAQKEGLILDPVYSGKAMAGFIDRARDIDASRSIAFVHTGGMPAIFAYQRDIEAAISSG